MKRGKHGEIGRAVFEHVVEVPDLEMIAHADEQRALRDAAFRSHPRRNRNTALSIQPCGGDKPEYASPSRIARLIIVVSLPLALAPVTLGNAGAVVHDHAGRFVVQTDEEVVVRRPRLDRCAEGFMKRHVTAYADARQRAAYKEIVHYFLSTESAEAYFRAAGNIK